MRSNYVVLLFYIFSVLVILVSPFIGSALSISHIFSFHGGDAEIFWRIRIPRVLMSFIAGAVFSVSGMVFQSIFRNPLATPYTLGVASGASLGTAIYFMIGTSSLISIFLLPTFSFAGAMISIILVYATGKAAGGSNSSMLLAGVAFNFLFSGIIMFIQFMVNLLSSHRIIRFMIGGLDNVSFISVLTVLPVVIACISMVFLLRRELDILSTGDDIALSRGVDIYKVKRILFINISIMLGIIVSITGPIGFVGMMVPHICRMIVGGLHRNLAPASIFFGGAFLTLCDTFSRIIIYPSEIPVGVITSITGAPFFIFLLTRRKRGLQKFSDR